MIICLQFRQIMESERVKRFADILKKENRLILCNTTFDCLENVKRFGNLAYSAVRPTPLFFTKKYRSHNLLLLFNVLNLDGTSLLIHWVSLWTPISNVRALATIQGPKKLSGVPLFLRCSAKTVRTQRWWAEGNIWWLIEYHCGF